MNTELFEFNEDTCLQIASLETGGRIPHAVIIESGDNEKSYEAAKFLSMYAVCNSEEKPCGECVQCKKAANSAHSDITYVQLIDKAKMYKIEQIRSIIKDSVIVPNDAGAKVYIFENADKRLEGIQQNALLKIIEEPPANVYFIFTCENSRKLLITIRSRCTLIRLADKVSFGDEVKEFADEIIRGIIASKEYGLLKALNVLTDKGSADVILSAVSFILRDGLALAMGGTAKTDEELGRLLSLKFTRDRLIKMIELTENQRKLIPQNVNMNLLATRLCGEYRRISWQR